MDDFVATDLTAEEQKKRFGYNNDYIAYFPINGSSEHGLLCINHEFANEELMFPDGTPVDWKQRDFSTTTDTMVNVEMAALGVTAWRFFAIPTASSR